MRVDLGPDPRTGKRRQRKQTFKRAKDAHEHEAQWIAEISKGIVGERGKQTVRAYIDHWLEKEARHTVRPSTLIHYQRWARDYIVPFLGHLPIRTLNAGHVRDLKSRLLDGPRQDGKPGGYSPETVRCVQGLLHGIMADAVQYHAVSLNVVSQVSPPRRLAPKHAIWSLDQARGFLAAAQGSTYYPIWLLAINTGLRRGELLALRWDDVDRANSRILVRGSLDRTPGKGLETGDTKDGKARPVLLPDVCMDALRVHATTQKRWQLAAGEVWQTTGYVFTTHLGTPIDPEQMVRAFHAVRERAGLPHTRFHDLRHLHATLLLHAGTHMKIVSERLGHANIRMTMDTYTHIDTTLQRQAADVMDRLFGHTPGTEQDGNEPNRAAHADE